MSYISKFVSTITIDSTATTTGYIPSDGAFINGRIINVLHFASTIPFTSNADVVMTVEGTSQTVLNLVNGSTGSWVYAPRQNIHSTTGGSTANVQEPFVVFNDRIKVNITAAATSTVGTFWVLVE